MKWNLDLTADTRSLDGCLELDWMTFKSLKRPWDYKLEDFSFIYSSCQLCSHATEQFPLVESRVIPVYSSKSLLQHRLCELRLRILLNSAPSIKIKEKNV